MAAIFNEILLRPLLNLLILIYNIVPGQDFGVAVVVLTILVRLILMPLSVKTILSQRNLAKIQPEVKKLQDKFKHDKQALAKETMALYQKYGVNPLTGCLPLLIQLPILFALYRAFSSGFKEESLAMLYGFVSNPGVINNLAFGFLDIAARSPVLAITAGALQFIQSRQSLAFQPKVQAGDNNPMANMGKQMLYFFPFLVIIISWSLPFGLTLYWVVATLFSILEQLYIKKRYGTN